MQTGMWAYGWQNSFVSAEHSHLTLHRSSAISRVEGIEAIKSWLWHQAAERHRHPRNWCSLLCRQERHEDYSHKLPGMYKYPMFARKSFNFFFQEVFVALSSTNCKFPNSRHLDARLKQGLFMLRLVVNCNSVESGRFVSQSSTRDCNCQWHLF